jgi:hypothetical protein
MKQASTLGGNTGRVILPHVVRHSRNVFVHAAENDEHYSPTKLQRRLSKKRALNRDMQTNNVTPREMNYMCSVGNVYSRCSAAEQ